MNEQPAKNLIETAVPTPPVKKMSDEEKKALELSARIEHAHGPEREALSDAAANLAKPPKKTAHTPPASPGK